ncbi:hypothetical protein MPTK1_Vg00840 [Marchantia polymorpha subsp. ruderalis]|uniref:Uncharacterized protein n=1 Tax=Marchantia polymorpha TaxID=3197 RepID=A0A2R6VX42_MARPO|nr:hypothetical protein MARPO_YA0033 [Marchantia polymorpha]BBN20595.1 hypothetical protein Mp_Vg00840 [Marchantia polymorpha subsp. ruderalis]|eukprot:PTQ26167.1 hypothetical protein MARPO_YA0033 [Marchantia polymorpha]
MSRKMLMSTLLHMRVNFVTFEKKLLIYVSISCLILSLSSTFVHAFVHIDFPPGTDKSLHDLVKSWRTTLRSELDDRRNLKSIVARRHSKTA